MNTFGLVHYWPIENDTKDYASNADMIYGANNTFCPDRFNNSNSALNFRNGYNSLTNGIYFDGDFTIHSQPYNLRSLFSITLLVGLALTVENEVSLRLC